MAVIPSDEDLIEETPQGDQASIERKKPMDQDPSISSIDQVETALKTDRNFGLTSTEAARRLEEVPPAIPRPPGLPPAGGDRHLLHRLDRGEILQPGHGRTRSFRLHRHRAHPHRQRRPRLHPGGQGGAIGGSPGEDDGPPIDRPAGWSRGHGRHHQPGPGGHPGPGRRGYGLR